MATPQLVQDPPENPIKPVPELVNVVTVGTAARPEITYTSLLFALQAVSPVAEFEAQELTTAVVGNGFVVGRVAAPSTLTTAIPVDPPNQAPLGT